MLREAYQCETHSRLTGVSAPGLSTAIAYLPGTGHGAGSECHVWQQCGSNVIHRRTHSVDLLGWTVGVINRSKITAALETVASVGCTYDLAGHRKTACHEDGT